MEKELARLTSVDIGIISEAESKLCHGSEGKIALVAYKYQ